MEILNTLLIINWTIVFAAFFLSWFQTTFDPWQIILYRWDQKFSNPKRKPNKIWNIIYKVLTCKKCCAFWTAVVLCLAMGCMSITTPIAASLAALTFYKIELKYLN